MPSKRKKKHSKTDAAKARKATKPSDNTNKGGSSSLQSSLPRCLPAATDASQEAPTSTAAAAACNSTTIIATSQKKTVDFLSPPPAGAAPFFSPPAADLTSSPVRRPIHTPYSNKKKASLAYYSEADDDDDDSGSASSRASRSSTPQQQQQHDHSGQLAAQVHDLNQLLTSPLVAHLGDLAADDDASSRHGGLGPLLQNDDDMSEEWDQLGASENMLRQELESFHLLDNRKDDNDDGVTATESSDKEGASSTRAIDSSSIIPPSIARQRLDPSASPLLPFYLFPGGSKKLVQTEAPPQMDNRTAAAAKTSKSKGSRLFEIDDSPIKEEKKEGSPPKQSAAAASSSPRHRYLVATSRSPSASPSKQSASSPRQRYMSASSPSSSSSLSPRKTSPRHLLAAGFAKDDESAAEIDAALQTASSIDTDNTNTRANSNSMDQNNLKQQQQQQKREQLQSPNDGAVVVFPDGFEPQQASLSTVSTFARSPSSAARSASRNQSNIHSPPNNKKSTAGSVTPDRSFAVSTFAAGTLPSPSSAARFARKNDSNSNDNMRTTRSIDGSTSGGVVVYPDSFNAQQASLSTVSTFAAKLPSPSSAARFERSKITTTHNSSSTIHSKNISNSSTPGSVTPHRSGANQNHNSKYRSGANQNHNSKYNSHYKNNQTFADDAEDDNYQQYDDQADAKALQMAKALYGNNDISVLVDDKETSSIDVEEEHDTFNPINDDDTKAHRKSVSELIGKYQSPSSSPSKSSPSKSVSLTLNETRYHSQHLDHTLNTTGRTFNDSRYHTAIQYSTQDEAEDDDRSDLGKELNQLMMQSAPLFSPASAATDAIEHNPSDERTLSSSSTVTDVIEPHPSDEPVNISNLSSGSSFALDPDISRLVDEVEDQLASSALTPATPPNHKQPRGTLQHKYRTNADDDHHKCAAVGASSSPPPAISEGILQIITDEDDETTSKPSPLGLGGVNDDEDDDMAFEMEQLESTQQELKSMLDVPPMDKYSLPFQPNLTPKSSPRLTGDMLDVPPVDKYSLQLQPSLTPKSPPRLTDDLYDSMDQEQVIAHPMPVLPKGHTPSEIPRQLGPAPKQLDKTPQQLRQQSMAPTTTASAATSSPMTTDTKRSVNKIDVPDQDLEFFHGQDPELQVTTSVSPALEESGTSSATTSPLSDEGTMGSSQFAVGSVGDATISTLGNSVIMSVDTPIRSEATDNEDYFSGSQTPPPSTAASPSLSRQLHLSPVSIASSSASTPQGSTRVQSYPLEALTTSSRSPMSQALSQVSPESQPSSPQHISSQSGEISVSTRTSTPLRSGKGQSTPVKPDSCRTLNRLVRTPSNESADGDQSGQQKHVRFVKELYGSPDSSVPFAPDEWDYRNAQEAMFVAQTLATGHRATNKDEVVKSKDIPPKTPQQRHDVYRPCKDDSDDDAASLNACLEELEAALSDDTETSEILSNSESRLKEMTQHQYERHAQVLEQQLSETQLYYDQRAEQMAMDESPEASPKAMPFAAMSSGERRRYLSSIINPSSANGQVRRAQSLSPTKNGGRSREAVNIPSSKMSTSSVKSADAWSIKSRADGRKDTLALNAALLDVGDFRPSQVEWLSVGKPSTKRTPDSARQKARKIPLSGTTPPKAQVDVLNDSQHFNDDDDYEKLMDYDVEGQDSKQLLDHKENDGENDEANEEENDKANARTAKWRNRYLCSAICLVWIVVLGMVVGLAVMLVRSQNSTRSSAIVAGEAPSMDTSSATTAPSVAQPSLATVVPTVPASLPPTSAPLTLQPSDPNAPPVTTRPSTSPPTLEIPPDSIPVTNSTLSLIGLLVSKSVDKGQALMDRTTPEYASLVWLSRNALIESYSDQQKIQRFVLGTVYYSMGGDEWSDNSHWMTDWDECKWFSRSRRNAVCNRDGEFVNLELGYLDVSGTIPNALGMLSNSLERLDIDGGPTAFITGTIPSELGLLTLMRTFRLSDNELTGTVPAELRRWKFLEILDLHRNNLGGALPLNHPFWPSLTTVDLGENYFMGSIPSLIGRASRISLLFLQDNLLGGPVPTEIGELTGLRHLLLDQNSLDIFPSQIGRLHQLESLMLAANRLSNSVPTEIGLLTKMRTLSLTFNSIQGSIPSELGLLVDLSDRIDMSFNAIEGSIPSEIGMLRRMKHLLLQSNKISGRLPDEVSSLDRLNTLRVDGNDLEGSVSDEICDVFNQTLPYFYADCDEIDCPCCIFCCEDGDGCSCRFMNTDNQYLCY